MDGGGGKATAAGMFVLLGEEGFDSDSRMDLYLVRGSGVSRRATRLSRQVKRQLARGRGVIERLQAGRFEVDDDLGSRRPLLGFVQAEDEAWLHGCMGAMWFA